MDLMTGSWDAGLVGYEELSIPMICLATTGCTVSQFGSRATIEREISGIRDYVKPYPMENNFANGLFYSSRVQFRPGWTCAEYLAGRNNDTHELWHPVKDRTCLLRDGPVGDNKFDQSREKG